MFLNRDITRHDMRQLVRRGLAETHGRYKALITLFGMPGDDYRRFMNFLAAHDCTVAFREFRGTAPAPADSRESPLGPAHIEAPVETTGQLGIKTTAGESPAVASSTAGSSV